MKSSKWLLAVFAICLVAVAIMLTEQGSTFPQSSLAPGNTGDSVFLPAVADWHLISSDTTPPPESACFALGVRCFTPQAMTAAYNYGPLYAQGFNGKGKTIAVIDSFGSPTIASDLHVFDTAFGLQSMCGEAEVTCTPDMPTFRILQVQGSPPAKPQPPNNGTGQENHFAWAVEVSLDVEWAHATAPQANIVLVTTPPLRHTVFKDSRP